MTEELPKVHPLLAHFPMMRPEELEAMGKSIAESGLIYPIVLDKDGVLLDGRCRLAACKLANVEPRFTTWSSRTPDDTPEDFILSMNVYRQMLPRGIRAMAHALVFPESTQNQDPILSQAYTVIRKFGADSEPVANIMKGASLEKTHQLILQMKQLEDEHERQIATLCTEAVKKLPDVF